MSKYEALTKHLSKVKAARYPMSFAEIEKIIGDSLPTSARKHRAWWSNNPDNSVMTKAWLVAGWVSSDVDMTAMRLVFRRGAEQMSTSGLAGSAASPAGANKLVLDGIPDETLRVLRLRARIGGLTAERLAADILVESMKLSLEERLALADDIRTKSPSLHELDVPAMIRDDRERQ